MANPRIRFVDVPALEKPVLVIDRAGAAGTVLPDRTELGWTAAVLTFNHEVDIEDPYGGDEPVAEVAELAETITRRVNDVVDARLAGAAATGEPETRRWWETLCDLERITGTANLEDLVDKVRSLMVNGAGSPPAGFQRVTIDYPESAEIRLLGDPHDVQVMDGGSPARGNLIRQARAQAK